MATNVNENFSNFQVLTGNTVAITRRSVQVTVTWTDDNGQAQSAGPQTVTFPDVLTSSGLPNGWLQDQLTQLCINAIRLILGIDKYPA